jgi:hypothetical protein
VTWSKRAVLNVADKKDVCVFKEQYTVQASKILSTISPLYGINKSFSAVLEILSVKK